MKTNRTLAIVAGCVAVLTVALTGWWVMREPPAPKYITAVAAVGDVEDAVLATGALQPFEVVNVGAQAGGQVTSVLVTLGQTVTVGQLIATIEPTQLQNQLRNQESQLNGQRQGVTNATANVTFQEANMARQQRLMDRGVGVAATYEQATNQLRSAKAQLAQQEAQLKSAELSVENARANLDRANIRAPISGVVAEIVTPVGTTVNTFQSTPVIAKLAKMDIMTVRAQVSEADIIKIRPGQTVYFTILGDPEKRYYAKLRTRELTPANGVLDPGAKGAPKGAIYYNALFEVPNPGGVLLPAMTAEVHVVLKEAKGVLTIPSAALGPKGANGAHAVRVLDADGKLVTRNVTVGLNNNFIAEIKSGGGLKAGDQVVIGEAGEAPAASASKPLFGSAPVQQP